MSNPRTIKIHQAIEILAKSRMSASALILKNAPELLQDNTAKFLQKNITEKASLCGKFETRINDSFKDSEWEHTDFKGSEMYTNTVILSPSEANQISGLLMELINDV